MWPMTIAISALIIGAAALIIGCIGLSIIVGIKNSTHNVQFVPIDPSESIDPKELEKKLAADNDEYEEDQL